MDQKNFIEKTLGPPNDRELLQQRIDADFDKSLCRHFINSMVTYIIIEIETVFGIIEAHLSGT